MPLDHYLLLALLLFSIGLLGLILRRNLLVQLMCLELLLNAVNVVLVAANRHWTQTLDGQVLSLLVLAVAAAEAAAGLALVIAYYRIHKTVDSAHQPLLGDALPEKA